MPGCPAGQALQEGFALQVDNAYSARLRVSCGAVIVGSDERTAFLRGWVHCMPSALAEAPPEPSQPPEPGAADLQQAFGVTAASVFLPQSIKTATCPTQLLAQANITTTGPGTVKYRWVHNNAEGPVSSVTFHQGGTAKLETHFTVGASAQGGFAPTPGGGAGGGFGMVQQAGGESQVQGYVRVKIVDTPGVQISDAVHYTVTCDDTRGADGLAATPTPEPPPTPQVPLGSGQLAVPAQPPLPGGAREAAPAGSLQMVRPAEPTAPGGRPDAARAAVSPRMAPAAHCPFEREAMCRVGGAWQNCCTLSDAGRILAPAASEIRPPPCECRWRTLPACAVAPPRGRAASRRVPSVTSPVRRRGRNCLEPERSGPADRGDLPAGPAGAGVCRGRDRRWSGVFRTRKQPVPGEQLQQALDVGLKLISRRPRVGVAQTHQCTQCGTLPDGTEQVIHQGRHVPGVVQQGDQFRRHGVQPQTFVTEGGPMALAHGGMAPTRRPGPSGDGFNPALEEDRTPTRRRPAPGNRSAHPAGLQRR
jgi:hypothetical protein